MYSGVPAVWNTELSKADRVSDAVALTDAWLPARRIARPKSTSLIRSSRFEISPRVITMMFSGFRSRCTTPRACAYPIAWQICWNTCIKRVNE